MGEFIDTMANIEYGLLIAIVLDALLLVVIASVNNRKQLSVLSYIIAVALLVPLTFQMSRLIGACDISSASSTINNLVGIVSPTLSKYVASATRDEIGWFIFRRVMWSVLFMLAAGIGICVTMEPKAGVRSRVSSRYERGTGRREGEYRPRRR